MHIEREKWSNWVAEQCTYLTGSGGHVHLQNPNLLILNHAYLKGLSFIQCIVLISTGCIDHCAEFLNLIPKLKSLSSVEKQYNPQKQETGETIHTSLLHF